MSLQRNKWNAQNRRNSARIKMQQNHSLSLLNSNARSDTLLRSEERRNKKSLEIENRDVSDSVIDFDECCMEELSRSGWFSGSTWLWIDQRMYCWDSRTSYHNHTAGAPPAVTYKRNTGCNHIRGIFSLLLYMFQCNRRSPASRTSPLSCHSKDRVDIVSPPTSCPSIRNTCNSPTDAADVFYKSNCWRDIHFSRPCS